MCLSTPKIPDPPPPPQPAQPPDTSAILKSRQAAGGFGSGGTVLTGSQGLATGTTNTGANTLLGH